MLVVYFSLLLLIDNAAAKISPWEIQMVNRKPPGTKAFILTNNTGMLF